MMYKLYNSGIAAYNHIGDAANAGLCFEKCLSYVNGAYVDEFIRTRNRLAVSYCDGFEYEKAAEVTKDTIVYADLLRENRSMVFRSEGDSDLLCGITCSQFGQILSYMRNPNAEIYFEKALKEMGEGTPNYYITLSYMLHHFISMGDREKYEKYSASYFGGRKSLRDQYEYLCDGHGILNPKYALYVYVKAMWVFYRESVPADVRKAFADIHKDFEERGLERLFGGDPWELIYKYLLLFAKIWKDYKSENRYSKILEEPIADHEGKTVEFIRKYGLIQYYEVCGNRSLMIQRARELYQKMVECGYLVGESVADGDRIMEILRMKFTYMNC